MRTILSLSALLMLATQAPATATLPSVIDSEITDLERQIVAAAEAMPAERFDFSPEALHLAGSDYKGVRTFAQEIKHVAASNYVLWSPLTSDKAADKFNDGKGPDAITTKADVIAFLKDSFALGHRGVAALTVENMLQPPAGSTSTRLHLAEFPIAHAYDHYGQIVEYLRMNGIVPPASR
jgi:hypothetical protein